VALLAIVIAGASVSVPFTIFQPGPTINVLGKLNGKQILDVSGHKTYRDGGQLRMVTIILTQPAEKVSVWSSLYAWLDPNDAVYPHDAVYEDSETNAQNKSEDAQMMASSQDNAVAAALSLAKIKYDTIPLVASIDKTSAAVGKLKVGDAIEAVDGVATTSLQKVIAQIGKVSPGKPVRLTVERGSTTRDFTIRTHAAGTTPELSKQAKVGVGLAARYKFPFTVKVRLSDSIGGPSAGMMFALSIYDLLTPGSLTDGKVIAGTGTIDADGAVGEIGGIAQKIAGAQSDGAHLFLVPAGNCDEAVHAHYDPAKMRLVKVSTLTGALDAVRAWTADPKASLPECPR